jgi:hypothetical protein
VSGGALASRWIPFGANREDEADFVILGTTDAGSPDSGRPDASIPDTGVPDAGADAGVVDSGTTLNEPDAATPDAGSPDANGPDANGGDSGVVDTTPPGGQSRAYRIGCGCDAGSGVAWCWTLCGLKALRRRGRPHPLRHERALHHFHPQPRTPRSDTNRSWGRRPSTRPS